jgi:hypothetical protein
MICEKLILGTEIGFRLKKLISNPKYKCYENKIINFDFYEFVICKHLCARQNHY